MKCLKIILDSDGVCVNTMKKVLEKYNKEYGLAFTLDDITSGNLSKIQKENTDMTKYFNEIGFFADLEPIFEAQKYIKQFVEDGHEVFICTAATRKSIEDKFINLLNLFPDVKEENIIPITPKYILKGDIMLDDGYHNIETSICDVKVLFNQPWNKDKQGDFMRVFDWKDFYELVKIISKSEIREAI